MKGLGDSREEVTLSDIADVLTGILAFETSQDTDFFRPGQGVVVYPKFLDKLDAILSSGDISADPEQSRWLAYEAILTQSVSWPVERRPTMLSEDDPRLAQWHILATKTGE
jgi:hypothetical protein